MNFSKLLFRISILLLIIILSLGSQHTYASKETDLFDDIFKKTDSKVVECGVKVTFTTDKKGENICNDIYKKLIVNKKGSVNIYKNENVYCLEFKNVNENGYIESMNYDNYNTVTINYIQSSSSNELKNIKRKIQDVLEIKDNKVKYFEYVKAETYEKLEQANVTAVSILKEHNAANLQTLDINNGFTTVAYTKQYSPIFNSGKLVDLNVAVCAYSNKNYIIVGTPEIFTTY